jgi:alkylation response protein AidB-like acyl-CoA dehydrogenase
MVCPQRLRSICLLPANRGTGGISNAAEVDVLARFPVESMKSLADSGLMGLCLSKEFGGQGEGMQPCRGDRGGDGLWFDRNGLRDAYSCRPGNCVVPDFHRRASVLKEISSGKHLTTLAFSEVGSRSQFWAPTSKLEETNGHFITSASKSWVTAAGHADSYVSTAQKPNAASPLESTVYFVRAKAAGVSVTGAFNGLGLRGNDSAPVSLEGIEVKPTALISNPGDGPTVILQVVLPWFAIGTAAMANGLCRAACNELLSI